MKRYHWKENGTGSIKVHSQSIIHSLSPSTIMLSGIRSMSQTAPHGSPAKSSFAFFSPIPKTSVKLSSKDDTKSSFKPESICVLIRSKMPKNPSISFSLKYSSSIAESGVPAAYLNSAAPYGYSASGSIASIGAGKRPLLIYRVLSGRLTSDNLFI